MSLTEDDVALLVRQAINERSGGSERSMLTLDHRVGVSDIGGCREYVRRTIVQEPFSDPRDNYLAAFVGTAVGDHLEQALVAGHPDWIVQSEVTATLPSGVTITGHPDIIAADVPAVWDIKTRAEIDTVRRNGPSQQQRFQRSIYALGAVQAGIVPEDGLMVGNIWIDRSGSDDMPVVQMEPFDRAVIDEADAWLDDVLYAVRTGEEASRDKPYDWCEAWCPRFAACRIGESLATGLLTDEEALTAVKMYDEGRAMESEGKRLKNSAKIALNNGGKRVQGVTPDGLEVSWTEVGETFVEGYQRAAYSRINLRRKRRT